MHIPLPMQNTQVISIWTQLTRELCIRTQFVRVLYIRIQASRSICVQIQLAMAPAYRTKHGRVFFFWMQPYQGIFLLDTAVSGYFPTGCSSTRAISDWTCPDDVCHGTTVTLAVKAQNITANTRVAFANTQWVPGIMTQSSSILYI